MSLQLRPMLIFFFIGAASASPGSAITYPLCTLNARADIFLMIDATFSSDQRDLIYSTLNDFYEHLSQSPEIASQSTFCGDQSQWSIWNNRVSGLNYYGSTYRGTTPTFCMNGFPQMVQTTNSVQVSDPKISMNTIMKIATALSETKCICRRWLNSTNPPDPMGGEGNEAAQLMIWIPARKEYDDQPGDFLGGLQLYSFQHFLLPYAFSIDDAPDGTIWKRMKEIPVDPSMRTERKTLVSALWKLLCEVTGAPGILPIPPNQ